MPIESETRCRRDGRVFTIGLSFQLRIVWALLVVHSSLRIDAALQTSRHRWLMVPRHWWRTGVRRRQCRLLGTAYVSIVANAVLLRQEGLQHAASELMLRYLPSRQTQSVLHGIISSVHECPHSDSNALNRSEQDAGPRLPLSSARKSRMLRRTQTSYPAPRFQSQMSRLVPGLRAFPSSSQETKKRYFSSCDVNILTTSRAHLVSTTVSRCPVLVRAFIGP